MELDVLRLHLSILHVDLVADKDDWNVFANADNIAVPVRNVLVSDTRRHVEHNDGRLSLDVVTITESSKFLLTGSVPNIECQLAAVRGKFERMDLHTERRNVLFLELAGQVAFYQCGFANTTIANKNQLEFSHGCSQLSSS